MPKIEVWNSNLSDKFICCQNIDQMKKEIEKLQSEKEIFGFDETMFWDNYVSFVIKDGYKKGDNIEFLYDRIASKQNVEVIYTDINHPIMLTDDDDILINSQYFEKNKDELLTFFREKILKSPAINVYIDSLIFSDDFLNQLIEKEEIEHIYFIDVVLSEEQINKLRSKFIGVSINNEEICSQYAFGSVKLKDLSKMKEIRLDIVNLRDEQYENFKYVLDGTIFQLYNNVYDYEEYFDKINKLLSYIDKFDKKIIFKVPTNINDFKIREYFAKSDLYNSNYKNIDLSIKYDTEWYTFSEFKKENMILDSILKVIIKDEMSPFEKYIAIYNYVKNFKPYKKENDDVSPLESRYLKYILKNEYMVCVGYAKLFSELLNKCGIEAYADSYTIDISYDKGFTLEDKPLNFVGHERAYVNLIDSKYSIDGFFISDPTWGNDPENNRLNHLIISKVETEKERRANLLSKQPDLIFSALDFKDFNEKTNYILTREFNERYNNLLKRSYENKSKNEIYLSALLESYEYIYKKLMEILHNLDVEKELYFKSKEYKTEQEFINFLTEFGHYLIKKNSCSISSESILKADLTVKELQTGLSEKQLNDYAYDTRKFNEQTRIKSFPFEFSDENYQSNENKPNKFKI